MVEYTPTGRIKKPRKTTCSTKGCTVLRYKRTNYCEPHMKAMGVRQFGLPMYAILGNPSVSPKKNLVTPLNKVDGRLNTMRNFTDYQEDNY